MKKLLFSIFTLFGLVTFAFSMQFGSIGSTSFGMAGTGVAIKNSAYSQYFNPALIASDSFFKFGVSAEIRGKSQNFIEMLNKDFKNLSKDDAESILKLAENTSFYVDSQNGGYLSFNGPIGAIGVGTTISAFAYSNVNVKNVSKNVPDTTKPSFDVSANFVEYTMLEIPLTYAYEFDTSAGDISVGVTGSFLAFNRTYGEFQLESLNQSMNSMVNLDLKSYDTNYSVNLGLFYQPLEYWGLGLTGKYLTSPKFIIDGQTFQIDPQARFGTALDFGIVTLGMDVDLTKNKFITHDFYNQNITFGMLVDLKFLSLKGGISTDLLHPEDVIFSGGLSLTVFDIGFQAGKKSVPFNSYKIPTYFALNIGAGFSF